MSDDGKPFHNPFGALSHLRGTLPERPLERKPGGQENPAASSPPPPGTRSIPRAVVRMERSGRGGKEVTVVEQLALSPSERAKWITDLKAALGCGGVVEGENLMLQGDQRTRLPALLTRRGVKKVIVAT